MGEGGGGKDYEMQGGGEGCKIEGQEGWDGNGGPLKNSKKFDSKFIVSRNVY